MLESVRWRNQAVVAVARAMLLGSPLLLCQPALADTLEAALAYTYANNPALNSQRAVVRATDEGVPTALAGYRPRAVATANIGVQSLSTTIREIGSATPLNDPARYFTQSGVNSPHGIGATVTQNLLNGFQRPPTARGSRRARCLPRAKRCATSSRSWCSTPPPPT
jgi:outer membrane protein